MKHRRLLDHAVVIIILSILGAPVLSANAPMSVDVETGAGRTYVVDAPFDVNVPASLACEVDMWEFATIGGGIRVTYRLTADPNGRQPAMLAKSAIKGSVRKLLDEVRDEILARAAR